MYFFAVKAQAWLDGPRLVSPFLDKVGEIGQLAIQTKPRRPVTPQPSPCPGRLMHFCAVRVILRDVFQKIHQKEAELERTQWRWKRLRCENWPPGVRPPKDHQRWCREVSQKIQHLDSSF